MTRLHGVEPRSEPGRIERVVIAGGTGSLGRALARELTGRGLDVVILTRRVDPALAHRQLVWDGRTVGAWAEALADPQRTAVVNLAGQLVDARPTAANIATLRSSRVDATNALVTASRQLDQPLAHWVQGSTTAIWSDAGEQRLTERSPLPTGASALPQMTGVAQPWEQASVDAHTSHRVVLRTSIVLQRSSPALGRIAAVARWGLGGRIGRGTQWFSWVHEADWLRIVAVCLAIPAGTSIPAGVLVGAAPEPVRNAELMRLVRRQLRRPPAPPTPSALVRVGSVVMRTDPALGLTGRHCTSEVLREAGFAFEYPQIGPALADLLG